MSHSKKRDPAETPEPKGNGREESEPEARRGDEGRSEASPVFVIQKHAASTLHYDFRIEVDGALRSFVVPKGLSTDPRDKRLAIPTEDHSLEYADFEGVIPEDEYGGGTVLVWDRGTYRNVTEKDGEIAGIEEALADGHVLVRLRGEKLAGGYVLQRTSEGGKGADPRWLLVKMDDDEADARRNPVSTEPRSVLSGRTIEEIAEEEGGSP